MSQCGSPPMAPFAHHDRNDSVPTLLEAFPVPPSHIPSKPPTPLPFPHPGNPPPSRPPSVPLPPLPGPSRFSDHDLLLLTSTRFSDARRDSVASSCSSPPSVRTSLISISPSYGPGRSPSIASSSSRSIRSVAPARYPSISSAPRPSISFSISEESAEFIEPYHPPSNNTNNAEQLTRLAISPMPFSDDDDEYDLGSTSPPILLQSPLKLLRSTRHNHHQDSISSIDMRDLPAADDDEDDEPHHHHHPHHRHPAAPAPPFNAFRAISTPADDSDEPKLQPRKLSISVPSSRDSPLSFADPIDPHLITLQQRHHPHPVEVPTTPTPSGLVMIPPPPPPPTELSVSTLPLNLSAALSRPRPPPSTDPSPSSSSSSSSSSEMSTAVAVNPQQLHREMRIARSKSVNHKQALRTRSRSKSASRPPPPPLEAVTPVIEPTRSDDMPPPPPPPPPAFPPLPTAAAHLPPKKKNHPSSTLKQEQERLLRSPSPDIDSIISSTPRFLKLRKQPSSSSSDPDLGATTRSSFASIGSRRSRKSSNLSTTSSSRWNIEEEDLKYVQEALFESVDAAAVAAATYSEPGAGGEESDSSLDLHTPLPHLMVKHGLLSPHSKLLPQAEGRSSTPLHVVVAADGGRPSSTLSMVTKTGLNKDERDTPMRKERHRDGRLLRGGLGLTTGLGWSDSEDEDAPSPLTRRLSTLNLSRRSSASSMQSSTSYYTTRTTSAVSMKHPLSRSYSGGTFCHDLEDAGDNGGVDEWGQRRRPRTTSSISKDAAAVAPPPPPPPTSWQGRGSTKYSSSGSSSSRIRTNSAGSTGSFGAAGRSNKLSPPTTTTTTTTTESHNFNQNSDDTIQTPSTASSLSIPLPSTPQDELSSPSNLPSTAKSGKGFNKDKTLPPLPLQPILKKQQSQSAVGAGAGAGAGMTKIAFPRSRTGSTTSPSSTPAPPTTPGPVRPLQLPQRVASSSSSGGGGGGSGSGSTGDRPAVPVPSVPPTPRYSTSSQGFQQQQHYSHPPPPPLRALTPSRSTPGLLLSNSTSMPRLNGRASLPSSPTTMTSGLARPKPRTGTGMAYKKSSYSSLSLNSSLSTGPAAAAGRSTSRIRAPMPLTTASLASVATTVTAVNNIGGTVGGANSSGLSYRTRSKTPVTAPTTPIGQAF